MELSFIRSTADGSGEFEGGGLSIQGRKPDAESGHELIWVDGEDSPRVEYKVLVALDDEENIRELI